jgi:hypothetical protein
MVVNRANDGRPVLLAPYVPGTDPGKFRGVNPVSRYFYAIRPFTLNSVAQFRPPPPPALDSATYAADVNETKAFGGAAAPPARPHNSRPRASTPRRRRFT